MSGGDESRDIYTPITVTLTANPGQTSRSTTIKFTGSNGTIINCAITQSAPVVSNTIYYGFGPSAEWVYQNGSHVEYARNRVYDGIAPEEDYHFYILFPQSVVNEILDEIGRDDPSYIVFKDGFPCVMHYQYNTFGNKQYVSFWLAALQQSGTNVRLKLDLN